MSEDPVSASAFHSLRGEPEEAQVALPREQATGTLQTAAVYYQTGHIVQEPSQPDPPIISEQCAPHLTPIGTK